MYGPAPDELKKDLQEYRDCHFQSPIEKKRGARICRCGDTCDHLVLLQAWRNYFLVVAIPIALMIFCPILFGGAAEDQNIYDQPYYEYDQLFEPSTDYSAALHNTYQPGYSQLNQGYFSNNGESTNNYVIQNNSLPTSSQSYEYANDYSNGLKISSPATESDSGPEYNSNDQKLETDNMHFPSGSVYAFSSSQKHDFGKPRATRVN